MGWQENPVITTIESAAYSMDNLDFPTVTICPGDGNSTFKRNLNYKNEHLPKKKFGDLSNFNLKGSLYYKIGML